MCVYRCAVRVGGWCVSQMTPLAIIAVQFALRSLASFLLSICSPISPEIRLNVDTWSLVALHPLSFYYITFYLADALI